MAMMNRVTRRDAAVLVSILVAVMLAVPVFVWAQASTKVVEVAVSGNQNINADTIKNAVALKVGDDYAEQAVEKDRASIMSLGYFVAVTVHKEDTAGGMKVTYEVTENPKLSGVKVTGSEPIPAAKIAEAMKTKVGHVLNTTTLNQDIEAIQAEYQDQGYIAYVTADVGVDPQTGVLTVPILVHVVESVEVTGNKKTKSYVFLREMKTQPGTVFNVKTLKDDIIKIYNLDILEDVKQYQITTGTEQGRVKISIPVVEKKTGQVSLGVGYSSRQKLVGQARLSETNFRGKAQGLNLLWEQGTSDAVGGSASYEVGFYEPWLDSRHTSLNVSAFNKIVYRFSSGVFGGQTVDDETYNERHKGFDATVSRPMSEKTRVYLGGRWSNVEANTDLLGKTGTLEEVEAVDDSLNRLIQQGDIAVASLRLVHNTRDFELDPAAGGYEGVSLEVGTGDGQRFPEKLTQLVTPAEGSTPAVYRSVYPAVPIEGAFQKLSIDVRRYFSKGGAKTSPQDKRTTLAVRFRAGIANGTLPFSQQFFVGGGESLRGFREDRFWGNNMMLVSAELRKPIAPSIAGVLFADYGAAWDGDTAFFVTDEQLSQHKSFVGNFGVGIGMRVSTPIGYLRLDYGKGIGPDAEGARTHFSMGHAF